MNTTYILIGVSFLLNLIVVLAFRAADKKDRSLKNINQQVKNFRYETTSFMNRFTEIARDSEQNITSRIEYANTVQNHLAESIDMVLVHQKELDELSGVCESYGNALKKLKAQTEQAENRVYAVQAEVRKTEAVKDYAAQFQKDIERLTAQLDSLKADYVRLVASTEQDLKAASASQKEENREMLEQFNAAIERGKTQLSEYVALERRGYDDMCRAQEQMAQEELEKLDAKCGEIDERIASSESSLDAFSQTLSERLVDLGERRDMIFAEIDDRAATLNENLEKAFSDMEGKKNEVALSMEEECNRISEKVDELSAHISERIRAAENNGDELSAAMERKLEEVKASVLSFSEENMAKVEKKASETIEDLDSAIRSTESTLEEKLSDLEDEISSSVESFQDKLKENENAVESRISDLQNTLDDATEEIRRVLKAEREETEKSIRELMEEKEHTLEEIQKGLDEKRREVESTLSVLSGDRDKLQSHFEEYLEEKNKAFSAASDRLEDDRAAYIQRCRSGLKDALEDMERSSALSMQRIKETSDEFFRGVADRLSLSEKTEKMLEETAYGKIREAEAILGDYANKIKESVAALNEQVEQVTSMKENIWNLQQSQKAIQAELDLLGQDREKLQSDTTAARQEKMNVEKDLMILKGRQKAFEESSRNEEEKKPRRSIIEEMDIITTGREEDVDVSDDDD